MIVIVVALEKEIPPNIRNNFPSHWVRFSALKSGAKHQYKNRKILIVVTGMGHKCEPAIRWICSHLKPQHIVNLGSAGAPTYPRHQWVIAKPVTASNYFHEHSPLPLFPALSERPIIAPCSSVPITQFNDGLIGQFRCNETALQSIQESSTQPINNSNQHPKNSSKINTSKLFRAQPLFNNNLIIDMELNPIASVCNEYQCNFSSIKFITDHNNEHKSINFNESLPIFHKQLSPVLSTILNTEKQFGIIQKILHDHFFHSKNLLSTNHNHIGDSKSKEKNVDISKLTLNSTKTSNKLSPVSNETSRHYKTYKTKKSIDLASNTEYQQSKNIAITSMQIFKDRTVDNQELFPKISVIIPTHHRQQQTISAIESVITQCYAPHEIIVVDDGSQPPFEYPCPNVQIIRLDTNQGVSAARNIGIQQATGDAIAFLDSDDEWQPHHLLELVKTLSKSPWLQWVQSNEHWVLNGHPKNKKSYHIFHILHKKTMQQLKEKTKGLSRTYGKRNFFNIKHSNSSSTIDTSFYRN